MKKIILSLCLLILGPHYSHSKIEYTLEIWDSRAYIPEIAQHVMTAAYNRAIRQRNNRRLENARKYPPFFPLWCVLISSAIGHVQKKLTAKYYEIKYDPEFKNAGYHKPILLIKRTFPLLNYKKS